MIFLYLVTGIIFGLGLSISGMTDPNKVQAFLSFGFDNWDPSLLFVLGSAVPVYALFFYFMNQRKKSINGKIFHAPAKKPIDKKLVLGSIIFGAGWGILGICPGPAITQISTASAGIFTFVAAMFIGFALERKLS